MLELPVALLVLLAASARAAEYNVLLFGDSLTEGMTNSQGNGPRFHPYAVKFSQLFQQRFPGSRVHQAGVSGERVNCATSPFKRSRVYHASGPSRACMVERLPALLAKAKAEGKPYTHVAILGGINDIGTGSTGASVFNGLKRLYADCKRFNAKVLAMTLLDTAFCSRAPTVDQERTMVNEGLRHFCKHLSNSGGIALLDIEQVIPYRNATEADRKANWDDGLHLSPAGYDIMGTAVFKALEQVITCTQPQQHTA